MGSLRAWGTYSYMVSKYFTALLINKTNKFPHPCHALKNSVAVKGLKSADPVIIQLLLFYLIS